MQHVGISVLSDTYEWHIISKQRGGILLITRNHCVIIIRQNLKLLSLSPISRDSPCPFHPRMSVVSFNSPWLTSLLSRILNARLKHLRIGFCNIYNTRIIGPLLNVTEVITVRCFLCIDFSKNDASVFQCSLLARVYMSQSNHIFHK